MFHTFPSAELQLAADISPEGGESWRWVELGLQIPYFLVSLQVAVSDEIEIGRKLLFGNLDDVLRIAEQKDTEYKFIGVGLLSPGYMNGTGDYQLGRVSQIWRNRSRRLCQRFLMEDGAELWFRADDAHPGDGEMELVLTIQ